MTWFAVLMPFLSLGVWTAGLINKAVDMNERATGGICVFCAGASLFCLVSAFFRFKWNHYQFDWRNGAYFVGTFLFLMGY
jgi:predicted permease